MTLQDALKELIEDYHLEDIAYDVRERLDLTEYDGNSWHHPRVLRFGEIVGVVKEFVDKGDEMWDVIVAATKWAEPSEPDVYEANCRELRKALATFEMGFPKRPDKSTEDFNLDDWAKHLHSLSSGAGWWDTGREDPNVLGTKIALIHSEASEMLEGLRKGIPDDHLPHRSMEEVECVDILIHVFDYAGVRGFDLMGAMAEKLAYNASRADHKKEAREASGGKKF